MESLVSDLAFEKASDCPDRLLIFPRHWTIDIVYLLEGLRGRVGLRGMIYRRYGVRNLVMEEGGFSASASDSSCFRFLRKFSLDCRLAIILRLRLRIFSRGIPARFGLGKWYCGLWMLTSHENGNVARAGPRITCLIFLPSFLTLCLSRFHFV